MLLLRDRRGKPLAWDDLVAKFLGEYAIVADDAVVVNGQIVGVVTVWTGGVEINEVTLTEEDHLFETRVVGCVYDGWTIGYEKLIDAIRGHDDIVRLLEAGEPPISKD